VCVSGEASNTAIRSLSFFLSFFPSLTSSTDSLQVRGLLLHQITLNDTRKHTHTVGLRSAKHPPVVETPPNNTQEPDSRACGGTQPANPASEQEQTYALQRAATGIGYDVIETV
jgi:hypothetical protein